MFQTTRRVAVMALACGAAAAVIAAAGTGATVLGLLAADG